MPRSHSWPVSEPGAVSSSPWSVPLGLCLQEPASWALQPHGEVVSKYKGTLQHFPLRAQALGSVGPIWAGEGEGEGVDQLLMVPLTH